MRQDISQDTSVEEAAVPSVPPAAPRRKRQSRIWRRTTMRRAIIEAVLLFAAGRLMGAVPFDGWPAAMQPLIVIPLARLTLAFLPPIWAASRVVSTKREKMSRRFWKLGPLLAVYCTLADTAIALALGETTGFLGWPDAYGPVIQRFGAHGAAALAPGDFIFGALKMLVTLGIYFTLAVVCTRLANGGFMRFTMPAGNGRVTL